METRYDATTKVFHWLLAVIIFAEYMFVWLIPEGTRGPNALASYHMSFGMLVLALMVFRIGWRLFTTSLPDDPSMPHWQILASKWTHWSLYVLLIILPLSGWLWISANGWNVTLFGALPLPHIIAQNASLGSMLSSAHETIASIVLAFVGLHVVAALYHWLIVKDSMMQRMWP